MLRDYVRMIEERRFRNRKMDKSFIDVSLTVLTVPGYVAFFFYLEGIFCYLKEIIYSRINTVVIVKLFLECCISVS